jgi:hypothetical protein
MNKARPFDSARSISLDFDGVLSTLVLGRTWAKTRKRRDLGPLLTPAVRVLKAGLAFTTEGLRKPVPRAQEVLTELRSADKTLFLLTSRTDERIAAAERWLDRYAWRGLFERLFFNADGEDADSYKARVLRAQPIDIHIDDDPETVAYLARLFPEKLFIHMNIYRRRSARGDNIVVVHAWDEIAGLFTDGRGPRPGQKETASPA